MSLYMVDSTFFNIFSFPFVYGIEAQALHSPRQCVLTRTSAQKLFGAGLNPVGRSVVVGDNKMPYVVTAVVEDVPLNTHFQFDLLVSMESEINDMDSPGFLTYLKLKEGTNEKEALNKCNVLHKELLNDWFGEYGWECESYMEPLASLHTSTKSRWDLTPKADLSNLFFVILIVIFILGIALSNFISLYMIQGEKRAVEIGIRKIGGAKRGIIAGMLFRETFFVTFIAFGLAVGLFYCCSGLLSTLLNIPLHMGGMGVFMWIGFGALYLFTAFLGGCYPAFYLSGFEPVNLIRKSVFRKYRLTSASVVVQFSIVIFCVSALFIVWRQLDYVQNRSKGYNSDNLLNTYVPVNKAQYEGIKSELSVYPGIVSVGVSSGTILSSGSGEVIRREGQPEDESVEAEERRIGTGFFDVYQIPLLAGRFFVEGDAAHIILSEQVAKRLHLKEPVGSKVIMMGNVFTVVGVVADIYNPSMRVGAQSLVYTSYNTNYSALAVKFKEGAGKDAKAAVAAVIGKRFAGTPYGSGFVSDMVKEYYARDGITPKILMSGTVLAISLALLGMLALSGFVAQQKKKEIGVKRVVGAQVNHVMSGLMVYVLRRVLPAIPFGIALNYIVMRYWLDGFVYSVGIAWWIYVLPLVVTLFVIVAAISYPSWKAARANPVDSLKSE